MAWRTSAPSPGECPDEDTVHLSTLRERARGIPLAWALSALFGLPGCTPAEHTTSAEPAQAQAPSSMPMPDLSGLAWVAGDQFLAVHDAKTSDAKATDERPRVSLVELPKSMGEGLLRRSIEVTWPGSAAPSSDLEAIARIAGTSSYLLVESGSASLGGIPLQRIFLADYHDGRLEIVDVLDWPVRVENVEGAAVAQVGDGLVFLFAERAEGRTSTALRWAPLTLQPLALGSFQETTFTAPDPSGPHARPVSAIEIDTAGGIFLASATDPGKDDGPFRSVIWRVGRIEAGPSGRARVVIKHPPVRLGSVDGLKVEAVAIRETAGGDPEIFFGTDDENHGGILRRLPLDVTRPHRSKYGMSE